MPFQAKDIGVWKKILRTLSTLTVITNGFLLGFTSGYVAEKILVPIIPNSLNPDGTINEAAILPGRLAVVLIFEVIHNPLFTLITDLECFI